MLNTLFRFRYSKNKIVDERGKNKLTIGKDKKRSNSRNCRDYFKRRILIRNDALIKVRFLTELNCPPPKPPFTGASLFAAMLQEAIT
jgi:hypothetical protein